MIGRGTGIVALALAVACTAAPPAATPPDPTAPPAASPDPSASPDASPAPTVAPPHPVSLRALMEQRYDGGRLRLGRVLARTASYTRYFATYRSDGLRISGILNRPRGRGPFPALVLAHGYIDPAVYVNGQGLRREQDYLASRGYVVLHTDYRNHASSDADRRNGVRMRLGYTVDAVNAVYALKRSSFRWIDRDRLGYLGRSMGGGVVYGALVARPKLVDAAVVFAPVSSDAVDNFNRWIRGSDTGDRILRRYGRPRENRAFWRGVSPRTHFDRVRAPVLIHHGTSDDSVPIAWSRDTVRALRREGKQVRYEVYEGEEHAFGPQWPRSMARTARFLRRHL